MDGWLVGCILSITKLTSVPVVSWGWLGVSLAGLDLDDGGS